MVVSGQWHKRALHGLLMGLVCVCVVWFGNTVAAAQTWGEVNASRVNVRDAASRTNSNVLYMVDRGQALEVLELEGDYYRVVLQDDQNVYIASEYVDITRTDGVALLPDVCVYESANNQESNLYPIGSLSMGEVVTVYSVYGEWYCVDYRGIPAYIPAQLIMVPDVELLSEKELDNYQYGGGSQALPDEIIAYAKTFLGTKYVYGSMSPQKGFDCSGFVSYVMKNFNISLNRSSSAMASNGTKINRNELQKCDLIFFATSGGSRISHVGMYIGDGKFIHSSTWGEGVVITELDSAYYTSRYVKATRVL